MDAGALGIGPLNDSSAASMVCMTSVWHSMVRLTKVAALAR
jgi:hypothetical protein